MDNETRGAIRRRSPHRAAVFGAVVPEAAGRELLLDDHGEAVEQTLPDAHDVPCKTRRGVTTSKRRPRPTENEEPRYAFNASFLILWAADSNTSASISQGFVMYF